MSSFVPESIALTNAAHFDPLWEDVGLVNRKIDGKFQLVEEALQVLEERSNSFYPTITKLNKHQISVAASIDITFTGVNFSADESLISVSIGGTAASITAGASTTVFHATLTSGQCAALGAAGDSVIVLVRIDGVLCPALIIPLVA